MKNSRQVLGLPVLSIEEGKQIGIVKHLVLNPELGKVSYLLVEDAAWYLGLKTMPFEAVQGIGEFGLTIGSRSALSAVADSPEVIALLEKNLRLPGTQVLSKKGRLVGTIDDFIIDENNAGIMGCQLTLVRGEKPAGIIPRKSILTFGRDFLVVEENIENMLVADIQESDAIPAATQESPNFEKSDKQPVDALEHFEEQQRKYLIGKKATMKIVADNGEVVAEEGDTITSEMIERAKAADRYIQLTLNIRD
ncbi:PRC-barrel domain-containing protein [Pelotomaculum sp. PtaB.Bin117]|uniref:PRC-barrel domain-containing protein n=1 Tax=Pelotomaculum sp. PtaB.Bin117 TaxID=1811694 RepID=UPI0009CAE0D4|nr:PRC-barrel domain-containing protein [Pelotomaculum sp. PtaB.Bin117]OPX89256.1 MAG: PRC-barrel domain protein [Pelotomaculum sp. PtaB.Bin117]OPY63885.1 MAG: PRC-barrel domain protein [Pelotomaculum sp. PtaU1.Bin065]